MILVLLGSTKSGSEGGRETPLSGVSRGGRGLEDSPVSHLNKPLEAPKVLPLPYSHVLITQ